MEHIQPLGMMLANAKKEALDDITAECEDYHITIKMHCGSE